MAASLGIEQRPVSPAQSNGAGPLEHAEPAVAPVPRFPRDWRIDAIRGGATLFVIVVHTGLYSPLVWPIMGHIGFNTPAEWFVVISGVAMSLMARPGIAHFGFRLAFEVLLRKARGLYLAALGVAVAVLGLSFVTSATDAVTVDWWDPRGVEDLYAHDGVLDLVAGLLTLRIGPWAVNILGLYIVLVVVVAPAGLWALHRWGSRAVVPLLGASFALYALSLAGLRTGLPAQYETEFATLSWQLLFVAGLVAGWFWADLRSRFAALAHRGLIEAAIVVAAVGFALHLEFGPSAVRAVSWDHADRVLIGPVRLVNVFVILAAMYIVLTRVRALERPVRFLLEGFGRNSLYLFLLQAFLLVGLALVLGVRSSSPWPFNLAVQIAVLILCWQLVQRRVLFRIVPR